MKILHTADWHLGKRLERFPRIEEQKKVMAEIVEIADRENADMVLVAGDLFDTFNPGTDAVELFYKTLKKLSNDGRRPVIAIAGNHDSPTLVSAPDPLARECGIVLIGYPNHKSECFENLYFKICKSSEGFIEVQMKNQPFPVRILHTPYANEARIKMNLGEEKEAALNQALASHWSGIAREHCDENGVNLLLAHLYINKRGGELLEEPDGERPLKIGNADLIYSDSIPSQIQYAALGHLHAHQNIGTPQQPAVYVSSPLSYSFSEAGQQKYVVIVDAEPGQTVDFKTIPLMNGRPLMRKSFSNADDAAEWLQQNPDALVELTMESETFLTADERRKISQSHDGIVHIIPKISGGKSQEKPDFKINLDQEIAPLFKDYFKSKNNDQEPNVDLMNLFNELINS